MEHLCGRACGFRAAGFRALVSIDSGMYLLGEFHEGDGEAPTYKHIINLSYAAFEVATPSGPSCLSHCVCSWAFLPTPSPAHCQTRALPLVRPEHCGCTTENWTFTLFLQEPWPGEVSPALSCPWAPLLVLSLAAGSREVPRPCSRCLRPELGLRSFGV